MSTHEGTLILFSGQNARERKVKKITALLEGSESVRPLLNDFGKDKLVRVLQGLLDKGIFESELRAKVLFPDLFRTSPHRDAKRHASRHASELSAARSTAEVLSEVSPQDSKEQSLAVKGGAASKSTMGTIVEPGVVGVFNRWSSAPSCVVSTQSTDPDFRTLRPRTTGGDGRGSCFPPIPFSLPELPFIPGSTSHRQQGTASPRGMLLQICHGVHAGLAPREEVGMPSGSRADGVDENVPQVQGRSFGATERAGRGRQGFCS